MAIYLLVLLSRVQRSRTLFAAFAVIIVYMVVRGHADTIVLREFVNPDEGDLLAGGRRAALSLIPFKDFTSFTYGPLWPFTLGWLHRLGMPLTLPMAHVLNAAIVSGCCVALAHVVWRRWNPMYAIVVITPIAVHWTKGFYSQDFYSLSTESLGLVWLVAGCIVSFGGHALTRRRAIAGAVVFGCVLWSKYAYTPLVVVALVALGVKMIESGRPRREVLTTCTLAPLAPFALLATWAGLFGVPVWKIVETLQITVNYFRGGGLQKTSPTLGDRVHETWSALSMFRTVLPLIALLAVTLVIGVVRDGARWRTPAQLTRLLAVGAIAASIASLMVFVPIYPHYTNLYLAGLILSAFLVASLPVHAHETHEQVVPWVLAGTSLLVLWALPPVLQRAEIPMYRWTRGAEATTTFTKAFTPEGGLWDRIVTDTGAPLSQLCPRGSRVLVWGWAPDLYSQYDWVPATRYVITTTSMIGPEFTSDAATYRPRLLADIRAHAPTCVVDGATQALFPSWDSTNSLDAQWPALVAELAGSYTRVAASVYGTSPLTVWVHKS